MKKNIHPGLFCAIGLLLVACNNHPPRPIDGAWTITSIMPSANYVQGEDVAMDSLFLAIANISKGDTVLFRNDSEWVKDRFVTTCKVSGNTLVFPDNKANAYSIDGRTLKITDTAEKTVITLTKAQ